MKKDLFKKYRKAATLLLIFNFLFISNVFGQMIPSEIISDESDIFPFADAFSEDAYTEDLYEITDEGLLDSEGNSVNSFPEREELSGNSFIDFAYAVSDKDEEVVKLDPQDSFEAYRESIILNWGGKRSFTEKRLKGVRENLEEEKTNFKTLGRKIVTIEEKLEPIYKEIETIKKQVDLLNRQLQESKNKIKNTEFQIAEKQIELRSLMWDIERSEVEVNIQRDIALDYIVLVYQEEEKFLDYYDESSSTLKLLLADTSVSENLLGKEYMEILEEAGREVFYELNDKKQELTEKREKVEQQQAELEGLHLTLSQERQILEQGRQTKKTLLEETKGQEEEYQRLLEESIQQQLESAIAVQNLQENIQFIEEKLELLDESLERAEEFSSNPEKVETLEDLETEVEEGLEEEDLEIPEEEVAGEGVIPKVQPFDWSVPPAAITAYYLDPTYPKRWGDHFAVDIRAKQFTEIRAPANAYVFQTKDNGFGYSYIILAHKNKLMTVYGHVTEIIAKPGTVVKQGDVIGLTGGTPGTKGAGWQTTGPHLHFEVYYKGEHVDPLDYLPVLELPIEYIPNKYLADFDVK